MEYLKIKDDYKVYKHTFPNNKVYIGITRQDVIKRWGNGNNYSNNIYLKRAIKKHDWNNIKHEVLFSGLSKEEAEQKEIELILTYNSTNQKHGYNITKGGHHIGMFTEETINKLKTSHKNKKMPEETKQKISYALKGRKISKESIEKQKNTKKKNGASQLSLSKCSENGKKAGKYNIKKAWAVTSKKVGKFTKEDKLIEIYPSISEASRQNKINLVCISYAANNKTKTAGGYIWHFI